jgi:hypothetical protein
MAFASVGSLGSNSVKVSGHDLTLSPASNVPAGNLVVLWTAWPINYSGAVGGEGAVIPNIAIHDTAGNIWSTLTSFMWESNIAIHCCRLQNPLTTGDVITAHHRASYLDPKAISAWEFTMDDPSRVVWVRRREPVVFGVSGGVDVPALNVSYPLSDRDGLVLHGLSVPGPNTDTYTWDANYTEIDGEGTTGGSDESNIHVRGGFRITDVTSEVIDVSADVTPYRAFDQAVVMLFEAEFFPDFPTFPVLDDFNRADEDDLDFAGAWRSSGPYPANCTPGYGGGGLRVSGNRATKSVVNSFGAGAQFWATEYEGCYAEVYATMAVRGQMGLHLDADGCGQNVTLGAFGAYWWPLFGGEGVEGGPGTWADDFISHGEAGFTGYNPGGASTICIWADSADNYMLGMQRSNRQTVVGEDRVFVHSWINRGSGWFWVGGIHDLSGPYLGTFGPFLGLSVWGDPTTYLDDFGGGYGPCPTFWVNMNWRQAERHVTATRALINPSDLYVP